MVAASLLTACGARSGLDVPPLDLVEPGPPPAYCQGAEDTSIYVVTDQAQLLRFDPRAADFTSIGILDCPVTGTGIAAPFSMAVDHQGTAYVVYDDGELFAVSTATASCVPMSHVIHGDTFTPTYGMGFSADSGGHGETLFLASTDTPGHLGALDTSTFVVRDIGVFSNDIGAAELTGTGDGRLFAFGVVPGLDGAHLAELDKADASVLSDMIVSTPPNPQAWAFAFWGGAFYFFTPYQVGRFEPADGSFDAMYVTLPTSVIGDITGAGASTCAPR